MMVRNFAVAICSVGAMTLSVPGMCSESYPIKPIRLVAPSAGGSGDWTARLLAQGMAEQLGQNVIVDNRSGVVAIETVARAAPDGYTMLFFGSGLWNNWLLSKVSYDPVRDFVPVIGVASSPSVITVHPSLPVHSVKELIALARAKSSQISYSSGPVGSVGYLAGELFKSMANINMVNVPYKGTGPSVIAVVSGEVQLTFAAVDTVSQHIKSGKLRALAVVNEAPTKLAPGLPTVSSAGLPGYIVASNNALWAPAGTPQAITNRLYRTAAAYLQRPDVDKKFFDAGLDVIAAPAEEFKKKMNSEIARWRKLIKDLGIRQDP